MTASRLRRPGAGTNGPGGCLSGHTGALSPDGEPFDVASEVDRLLAESQAELDALLAEADAYERGLQRELAFEEQRLDRARHDAAADLLGGLDDTLDGIPNAPFDLELAALREGEPDFRRVPVLENHADR
jgi:hypothetical protein